MLENINDVNYTEEDYYVELENRQIENLKHITDQISFIFNNFSTPSLQKAEIIQNLVNTLGIESVAENFVRDVAGFSSKIFPVKNCNNLIIDDNDFQSFINKKIKERAELFKSIPIEVAKNIIQKIFELTFKGYTDEALINKEIKENYLPNYTKSYVKLLVQTEISKTLVNITEFKCRKNNIPAYKWKTRDSKARKSHFSMSNVIIFWDDPPAPEDLFPTYSKTGQPYKNSLGHYHAGCCPNCRCIPIPLKNIDSLNYPVRVYLNGQIKSMNEDDFISLYRTKAGLPKETQEEIEERHNRRRFEQEEFLLKKYNEKLQEILKNIRLNSANFLALQESGNQQNIEVIEKLILDLEKRKIELKELYNSIIISSSSSLVTDSNIFVLLVEKAEELKEKAKSAFELILEVLSKAKGCLCLYPEKLNEYKNRFEALEVSNIFIDDMSPFVAEKMIKCISNLFDKNPNLKGKIKSVGEIKNLYEHVKDDWIKEEVEKEQKKEKYKYIPFDEEEITNKIDKKIQTELRLNDNKTNAYNLKLKEENEEKKKHLKDLEGIYICSKESKGVNIFLIHPQDCNCVEGTINHELGHFLDYEYGIVKFLKEYFEKKYTQEEITQILNNMSKYVASIEDKERKYEEFVAEIFSEMLTSKNPRQETVNIFQEIQNKFTIRL